MQDHQQHQHERSACIAASEDDEDVLGEAVDDLSRVVVHAHADQIVRAYGPGALAVLSHQARQPDIVDHGIFQLPKSTDALENFSADQIARTSSKGEKRLAGSIRVPQWHPAE